MTTNTTTNVAAIVGVCIVAVVAILVGYEAGAITAVIAGVGAFILAKVGTRALMLALPLLFLVACNTPAAQQGQGATEIMQAQGVTANIRAEIVNVTFSSDTPSSWQSGSADGGTFSDQSITLQPQATGEAAATAAPETSVPVEIDVDGVSDLIP